MSHKRDRVLVHVILVKEQRKR